MNIRMKRPVTVCLACTGGLILVLLVSWVTHQDSPQAAPAQPPEAAHRAALPKFAVSASGEGSDRARHSFPDTPAPVRQPSIYDPATPVPGPPFLRFFAHDPEGMQELMALYEKWERMNPRLARKLASLISERMSPQDHLAPVSETWSVSEIGQVLKWIGEMSEGETQFPLLAEVGKRLFRHDPAGATDLVDRIESPIYREAYISELGVHWAMEDPAEASKWIEQFPAGEMRDRLQMRVAIACGEREPAAAADYIVQLAPGETRDSAARTVTRQWAVSDPRAAAEWAAQYPDPKLRYELISTAVSYWMRQDRGKLTAWIRQNAAEPLREAAAELSAQLDENR